MAVGLGVGAALLFLGSCLLFKPLRTGETAILAGILPPLLGRPSRRKTPRDVLKVVVLTPRGGGRLRRCGPPHGRFAPWLGRPDRRGGRLRDDQGRRAEAQSGGSRDSAAPSGVDVRSPEC